MNKKIKSKEKNLAVIYAKPSSSKSIGEQINNCIEYAEKEGYCIIARYCETGTVGNCSRDYLKQMLEDSENQQFQYIIVDKIEILGRDRYDSAIYKSNLKKNGITVISARKEESKNLESNIVSSMMENFAEYYSFNLSKKIKDGIKKSNEIKADRLEKLKDKKVRRLDVLAQLSEAERRVIFDNMGFDFEESNANVLAYKQELKESVAKLFS